VPAAVREGLSEAEARIIVTDTNFMQRSVSDMLPSELAKSLKMQLDACKEARQKQGFLDEIQDTSNPHGDWDWKEGTPVVHRSKSVDEVAYINRMNRENIRRYIRLNSLIDALLDRVDSGEISLRPAVALSYLKQDEQRAVLECLDANGFKIDMFKANMLRSYSETGKLTADRIYTVLSGGKKPGRPARPAPIKVSPKIISKYFTQGQSQDEINETIEKALVEYLSKRGRA
jgi:ParB family chromosome partitioning protein